MERYAAGADIGGTNSKIGIVSSDGKVISKTLFSTAGYPDFHDFAEKLAKSAEEMAKDAGVVLEGFGIGAPNGNFLSGNIEYAPNMPWKGVIPIADEVEKRAGLPVFLNNDADCAAIGEKKFGAAADFDYFIVITLGTGMGSGVYLGGKLFRGKYGFGSELGHTSAVRNGRKCRCGRRGCIEAYVGAAGIVKSAVDMASSGRYGRYDRKKVGKMSCREIALAAAGGDPLFAAVFDYTGELLGEKLADFAYAFAPEAFIITGGISVAGDILMEPLKRYFKKNLTDLSYKRTEILLSGVEDSNGGIKGAAAAVFGEGS